MKPSIIIFMLQILFLVNLPDANARPEYAVQHRITSCAACHVSPFGAGPRNVDGKMYGSRFDKPSPWSLQDRWSADIRAIAFYPQGGTIARQGLALMTNSFGLNLPVNTNDNGSELRLVAGYSFGVVLQGPRDMYALWQSAPRANWPAYVQFGRFNSPFGLFSDEHRSYTKVLTRSGIFDYEFGGAITKDSATGWHYDFALTNGMQSGGAFDQYSPNNPDSNGAVFLNIRNMPSSLPFILGASAEYQSRMAPHKDPWALAGYMSLSLDRLSKQKISGSLTSELVYAVHFSNPDVNSYITRNFIPQSNTDYIETVREKPAIAWTNQINYNYLPRWTAQYKLDYLNFYPKYSGDRYLLHGFGVKHYVGSNVILMSRYEIADIGRPEIKGTNVTAAHNAFWLMLQLWL